MALNMARAHSEVAPATLWEEADIEVWSAPDADVTSRLVRAIAAGCAAEPALNAWFDGKALTRQLVPSIDLGIAIDTPDGLIVPVLRDIADRDDAALRRDIDALKNAARNRTLAPAELRRATITLSNFRMLAGRQAALVVVPPQVAIIGAGRIYLAAASEAGNRAFTISCRCRLRLTIASSMAGSGAVPPRDDGHARSGSGKRRGWASMIRFGLPDRLGPLKLVHIWRPTIGLKAVVAVDNVACRTGHWRVRVAPDVTSEEALRLARAMTLKMPPPASRMAAANR